MKLKADILGASVCATHAYILDDLSLMIGMLLLLWWCLAANIYWKRYNKPNN